MLASLAVLASLANPNARAFAQEIVEEITRDIPNDHDIDRNAGARLVEAWPDRAYLFLKDQVGSFWNGTINDISTSLFESIMDLDLFSVNAGPVNIGLQVQRRIFNNFDLADSWTVVDRFRVPLRSPLIPNLIYDIAPNTLGALKVTGHLNLTTQHIRQVAPKLELLDNAPSDVKNQLMLQLEQILREDKDTVEDGDLMDVPDTDEKLWARIKRYVRGDFQNPELRARFRKLYRLFLSPLGFPVTEKALLKMPVGDIRVFEYEGLLEVSALLGIDYGPVENWIRLQASAGASVYVGGLWQVAILRLPEDRLRIKVTRGHRYGSQVYLGAAHDQTIIPGVVVLGERVGKITETIIPFSISMGKEWGTYFDQGYEYDLKNSDALKAAHHAVFGNLTKSQQLYRDRNGVSWRFQRKQKIETQDTRTLIKLSFLFERGSSNKTDVIDAEITLPDGTRRLFQGISNNLRYWDAVIGGRERKHYAYQILMDPKAIEEGNPNGTTLRVSGLIEDAKTTGREFRNYIDEVEEMTGDLKLFSEYPVSEPRCRGNPPVCEKEGGKNLRYGRTYFYYRLGFNHTHLTEFLEFPLKDRWSLLEKAYRVKEGKWSTPGKRFLYGLKHSAETALNLPLAVVDVSLKKGSNLLSATRVFNRWKKINEENYQGKKLVEKITYLFRTRFFGTELVRVLKLISWKKPYEVYVSAQAPSVFGHVSKLENRLDSAADLYERLFKPLNFERPDYWRQFNKNAQILSMSLSRSKEKDKVTIKSVFEKAPKLVFISVAERRKITKHKVLGRFVFQAGEDFKLGTNVLELIKGEDQGRFEDLKKLLLENQKLIVKMAYSIDGEEGWGPVVGSQL